jgi:hypothetical protein
MAENVIYFQLLTNYIKLNTTREAIIYEATR